MTRGKIECEICSQSFARANIASHKTQTHSYCQVCKLLVSRKRHSCFRGLKYPTLSPKQDDQFLLVYIPVLIRRKMYKKLESDIAVWPLNDIGGKQSEQAFLDEVKSNLKKTCLTCCLSEFIDVTNTDQHSCDAPNRPEFVAALSMALGTDHPSEDTINDIYQTIFGHIPNFIEPQLNNVDDPNLICSIF